MTSTEGDVVRHKPQWSGLTYMVGSSNHVMPLYEDDKVHETMQEGDCPCNPDVSMVHEINPKAPPRTVYHHKPLRWTQQ